MTRILVVDDSRTQLEMAVMVLQSGGFQTDTASSAEAALAKLAGASYDVVISDIVMPEQSGYDLCRAIKHDPATKDVPVILLTTLKDPMDIIRGLECGADNFLTKPCEPSHLLARVNNILDNQRLRSGGQRRLGVGVEITFLNNRFTISSDREQILDLLIATFEDIVLKNGELEESKRQLADANRRVNEYAEQLEGKVRLGEEQFRTLFEAANDAILVIDFDTATIQAANAEAMRLMDRPLDDLIGRKFFDLTPRDSVFRNRRTLEDWIARGRAIASDIELLRSDGTVTPAEISARKFKFESGRPFVHTIIRDLTERKRWEAERAHLATFPEESVSPIFEIDRDGGVRYTNPACREVFPELASAGYEHPVLAPLANDLQALRSGDLELSEFEVSVDNRVYLLRSTYYADPGLIRVYADDITQRKNAENRLRESELQLRTITDALPVLIVYIGTDLKYRFINRTGEEWLARPSAQILGQHLGDVMGAAFVEQTRPRLDAALAGQRLSFSAATTYPDGVTRDVEVTYIPRHSAAGEIVGILGLAIDATERRSVEAQLRQAQKMEAIGNLTGGLAHDFNNLLTIVTGNLTILLEDISPDDLNRELAQDALEAAWRGAELNRQLLAFARRQPLEAKRVNVNDHLDHIVRLMQRTLGETVRISSKLDSEVWPVFADPAQLETAVLNLSTNARDAMPDGGSLMIETANVKICEDYTQMNPDIRIGEYVVISVTDTGTGMSPETVERIFEPFFTTKPAGTGTGLGLAMVFGFARQSGGQVKAYSELGHGTTMRLYLPRDTDGSEEATVGATGIVSLHGNETILVVDDNQDVQRVIVRQLVEFGYRPLEAADAAEALALLDQHPEIDLLVTDMIMPEIGGIALTNLAREKRPDLPVVFVSGFPGTSIDTKGGLPDRSSFISKPFRREDMAGRIRKLLDG